jgi:hypothetical protein
VKEGLLLDGVDVHADELPVDEAHQDAVHVLADRADAALACSDEAPVGAERAPDLAFLELLVEPGLPHSPIISDGFPVVNLGLREPGGGVTFPGRNSLPFSLFLSDGNGCY